MISISIEGESELGARLAALPDALRAALAAKAEALAQALYAQVVDVNLSGGILKAGTGALRDSIAIDLRQDAAGVEAQVFSNGDVPYAAILEFGGKTAAHEIMSDKAGALAFVVNGKAVFARAVQHPGSTFEPRSWLGSALDDAGESIAEALAEVVFAGAKSLGEMA